MQSLQSPLVDQLLLFSDAPPANFRFGRVQADMQSPPSATDVWPKMHFRSQHTPCDDVKETTHKQLSGFTTVDIVVDSSAWAHSLGRNCWDVANILLTRVNRHQL
jgi:hypothetical protein